LMSCGNSLFAPELEVLQVLAEKQNSGTRNSFDFRKKFRKIDTLYR
jgi:hypothetical protein